MKLRKALAATLTAAMVMSTAAVSTAFAEETKQADKIVVALPSSSFDMSPFGAGSEPRFWMVQNVYGSLYCMPYYGASLEEMQPWLAKGYEKVDDVTYKIELWDNITDSKGNAITAEDIVFSYEQMRNTETRIGTYLDNIEVVDDYNLIFHLKKYGPGVIEFLLGNHTLSICDKDWFEGASDEEKFNDPATTGAYKIVDYASGASITLEARDDYWKTDDSLKCEAELQNVKTIEYQVITETSMRSIALENHEIDATTINASELKRFYADGQALEGWTVNVTGGPFCNVVFLNMDEGKSIFADNENLRKAALYALDSESILYGGDFDEYTGEVCYSLGTSAMAGYKAEWAEEDYFTYDPDKAREYYEASGYKDGEATIRLLSRTNVADGTHSVMVANLQAVGFNVELLSYDQALFNNYKYDSTQWDMIFDGKGATGSIVTCWDNNFNPAGFTNGSVCFTHDDKLVELLTAATTTGSDEDIEGFHSYLKELACAKGLYTTYNLVAGQDGITKLALTGNMYPRVNAFEFADDYQSVAQ
ncbi:MAG: ABC transporter substrate-binding protein [Candidatus Limivivens sp.]|nr:ABC transporter substrate-binding protein [Candidatus Limivivens sp.]